MAEKATVRAKDAAENTAETVRRVGESNVETLKRATDEGAATLRGVTDAAGQGVEQLTAFGRGNVEALVEARQAALQGWQEINREFASYVRAQLERNLEAGRALARARTPQEALRVHGDYVRASLEGFAGQASKMNQLAAQVFGASVAPLQARASEGAEQVSRRARG
ncbi:MAG TPA: phasin family protein [Geminicoccaceae bacterium]|nr:phasin family protein [Geminicoccaceae bacterium]